MLALTVPALLQPALVLADQPSAATVTVVTQTSSPIELTQAQILAGADGNRLWIVYRNVSKGVVNRFAVTLTWRNAAGRAVTTIYKMVNAPIGPGEATTAELSGIGAARSGSQPYAQVTRARFSDLALWVAPPPPPPAAANATAGQSLALREPVTAVVNPTVSVPASVQQSDTTLSGTRVAGPVTNSASTSGAHELATLPEGTAVNVIIDSDLTSAKSSAGDRVEFRVANNITVGGIVVIPVGSRGVAHVAAVRHAGLFGRSGSLTIVPDLVATAAGALIPLQGATVVHPPTTPIAVIADITIFGGLFARGREAVLPAGSVITATTATQVAAAPGYN